MQLDGSLTTRVDLAQEDLVSALDGDLVVEAEAITVLQGLTTQGVASGTTGDVRLQARTTDVDVQALIGGVTGHVTIVAARDVLLAGLADVISNIAATTIHVNAGRDVTMTDGASIRSAGDGDVRLSAGEDIGLALVDVGTGAVALEAGTGSITDTQTPVGDANVVAAELIMVAGTGIGAGANAIETTIDTLALDAGTGGAFVRDNGRAECRCGVGDRGDGGRGGHDAGRGPGDDGGRGRGDDGGRRSGDHGRGSADADGR